MCAARPTGGPEQLDALVIVLDLVRSGAAPTRPELLRRSGLGRTVITLRLAELIERGLVEEGGLGRSNGGRAPRHLRFCAEAGHVLVADLGATSIGVGLADLAGRLLDHYEEAGDVARGPQATLDRVEQLFDELLGRRPVTDPPVWGVGIGVPGPVEFATGRPIAPPIMPGWDGYPIRERFAARYNVPIWVDNDVNIMALGELRAGLAQGERDFVYLKIGTGIGAGLISGGRLHRGAQGCAGDVGHVATTADPPVVCRCGNVGCLEAQAGGAALARDGALAAADGRSRYLADVLRQQGRIEARDVALAAAHGDPLSVDLLTRSGRLVGEMLARVVNFFNPSLIVIGGGVAAAGDLLLASIRQTVYGRSLPLATRDLRITRSPLDDRGGLMGAAFMVIDELFARDRLGRWIAEGSPAAQPELAAPANGYANS